MAKIFISYAREDIELACKIYYDLKESGLEPWIDREDLLPGQQWKPAIRKAIQEASHFVALLSARSVEKRGFLNAELYEALEVVAGYPPTQIFIIPVRIEDCEPSHDRLRDLNWVDLFPNYGEGLKRIVTAISRSEGSLKKTPSRKAPESLALEPEKDDTLPLLVKKSLKIGSIFADRYKVEQLVGHGGMGVVYRVVDTSSNQLAALKLLSSAATEERGFSERFAREIHLLARLAHPCIPKILNAGVAGAPYFVSEYIHGRTLRQVIDEHGSLSAEKTAEIGAAVADALAAAHAQGIIHRDIKPHNVMIREDGGVFLIDFGIARATGPDMKSLTETGMLLGTPHYMAPEQIEDHYVDERSDIYSLGVVLFEAVTGQVPFTGNTPFAVGRQHSERQPPRPRTIKADIPPSLEAIILRCLDKKPSKRPWSATELASSLRRPHKSQVKKRRMDNGDWLEEAPAEIFGYALKVSAQKQKRDWIPGMALHCERVLYKLEEVVSHDSGKIWEYRFVNWPAEEVLRRLIDYDSEIKNEVVRRSPWRKILGLFNKE